MPRRSREVGSGVDKGPPPGTTSPNHQSYPRKYSRTPVRFPGFGNSESRHMTYRKLP